MVLLGFSVLGSPPVSVPLETSEMRESVEKLERVRKEILETKVKDGRVNQLQWTRSFRGRDDDDPLMEHEAFLSMWLSHYVLPRKSRRCVSRIVLPMAVRLARGERLALAPSVLATIYRDLGEIQAFARGESTCKLYLSLKGLLKLVQVWAWERFKNIRPEATKIRTGEPRIAQWSSCSYESNKSLRSFDDFEWRPYTKDLENWSPPRFYLKEAMWMTVDEDLDDEFVSFARCLRVSKLVGIGFVEDYYPNRVAMQFGFSQDLPGLVSDDHRSFTEKQAWDDYSKSLDGSKLYVPSRLATTASVTARYREWWVKSVAEFSSLRVDDYDDSPPPKVMSLCKVIMKLGKGFPAELRRCRKRRVAKNVRLDSTEAPLSCLFQKELRERASEHSSKRAREDSDENTTGELIKSRKNDGGDSSKSLGEKRRQEVDNIDDGVHVNGINVEKKTVVDDGVKEAECLLHEDREKQRSSEEELDDDDYEMLRQRKLAIDELVSNLEARFMELEKCVAKIRRQRKIRRNKMTNGVSA